MKNKNFLIIVVLVLIGIFIYLYVQQNKRIASINSFEECAAAGYPLMESYPARCSVNGKTFTQNIGNELEKKDLIVVDNPRPNQLISNPLQITGRARGGWYFEADFPIFLYDKNGNLLGQAIAQAKGDWMTVNFVPFSATLNFQKPESESGTLVFEKSNPSALDENADSLTMPVRFK